MRSGHLLVNGGERLHRMPSGSVSGCDWTNPMQPMQRGLLRQHNRDERVRIV